MLSKVLLKFYDRENVKPPPWNGQCSRTAAWQPRSHCLLIRANILPIVSHIHISVLIVEATRTLKKTELCAHPRLLFHTFVGMLWRPPTVPPNKSTQICRTNISGLLKTATRQTFFFNGHQLQDFFLTHPDAEMLTGQAVTVIKQENNRKWVKKHF